jgi:hypothetical protein
MIPAHFVCSGELHGCICNLQVSIKCAIFMEISTTPHRTFHHKYSSRNCLSYKQMMHIVKVKVTLRPTTSRSVSNGFKAHVGLTTGYLLLFTFTSIVLSITGTPSDVRSGLSFVIVIVRPLLVNIYRFTCNVHDSYKYMQYVQGLCQFRLRTADHALVLLMHISLINIYLLRFQRLTRQETYNEVLKKMCASCKMHATFAR